MKFSLDTHKERRLPRKREEASLQVRLMADLESLLPRDAVAFAVPNGGFRNVIEGANLKRQGVKAGVPDIIICHKGRAFGLELKAKNGMLSDSQKVMFPILRQAGMRIEIARTHPEAIERLREMGIPLRDETNRQYEARDVFREETRRRA